MYICYIINIVLETVVDIDSPEPVRCVPWTSRFSKMVQPNLDYIGECFEFFITLTI